MNVLEHDRAHTLTNLFVCQKLEADNVQLKFVYTVMAWRHIDQL